VHKLIIIIVIIIVIIIASVAHGALLAAIFILRVCHDHPQYSCSPINVLIVAVYMRLWYSQLQ
jgi:uncharacterized protein YneF (UPF0154 family)